MFQECCAKFESNQDKPEMTMNLPFLPPSSVESDQISAPMSLPSAIATVATGQTGNFSKDYKYVGKNEHICPFLQ